MTGNREEDGKDNEHTEPGGTIPDSKEGVGATNTGKSSTFEPEEDEEAADGDR